ncbi:RagB/SusD family nutrient uptake outer membrane protein [Pedobacter gandavensis]|uniref:RagB/SusD family nutrient uptake outer membrane protein n=1 Tax=Pedobacter gandavensis TaxID=2679963 RepID=A0ABR6ESQ3_9SPHI|nr:RagB/SusD family nutrient uptake outer membrane protein [Pedobacter gandavensis]MBB2148237.1 RagB/SusD family nutrient uptake outer membrane protein [Pedobacter gandavensis]
MKKIIYYGLFSVMVTGTVSCKKDFLSRQPKDLVSELDAYGSVSGIEALTVTLYNDMQTEDLNSTVNNEAGYASTTTDEAVRSYPWGDINNPVVGNWYGGWDYKIIRRVNDFIGKMPSALVTEDQKKRFIAEGKFIRAFHYFSLVKRYGGVPLVTVAQQFAPGDDIELLKVQRSKEQEIYDFIAKELDEAIVDLPETNTGPNTYRVNKFAALALKSRAMLYAASSAKYATVQINGLVGIPANLANAYWQKAMDAAQLIMESGKYSLYKGDADKATNFQKLFLNAPATEAIFTKAYQSPDKAHSFDFYNAPQSFRVDYGNATNPTLEMVEEFEYTDGTPGTLRVLDGAGNPIVYNKPTDLFLGKDPRMFATILTPFDDWQGGVVEIRRGVIDQGVKYTSEVLSDGYPEAKSEFKKVGKDGPLTTNDPTKTGFYIKKFMDPVNRVPSDRSTTPWMVFRFGEVLLNYAEAAFELGKDGEALTALNQIRERAGIATVGVVSLEKIRHERKVELAFENHRVWDLRRWRTATSVLNNTQFHALYPWIMWEANGDPKTMKYTFEKAIAPKNSRTFPEKLYYEPVPQGTPVYVQNPLY